MAHYIIDTETSVGSELQAAINHLRAAQEGVARVHGIMSAARGAPADDTKLEGGVFGIAATEGDEVFALVNSIQTELAALTVRWVASIDQGG
jgi:hypothetical protein